MQHRRILILLVLAAVLVVGTVSPLLGQGENIVTIGVPSWMSDVFRDELNEGCA